MMKKIIIFIAILFFIGLGTFGWLYREKFFPKSPEEDKTYKIAVVLLGGAYSQALNGLKDEMKGLGYLEGKNIFYDVKDTKGDQKAIGQAVEELLKESPNLFYTISTPVTSKVWEIVKDRLPIVFNIVGDPVGAGLAASLSSSKNNLTGCSNLSAMLSGKRLEIFKEAFPYMKNTVTFYDPDNKFSQISINNTREAVPKLGVKVEEVPVKTVDDLAAALAALKPGQYDGIFLTPDAMVISKVELVVARAIELGLPVMGHEETLAEKGVTIIYGADFYQLGVQCAPTVLYVLRGQKPQDIPIQSPKQLYMVINLKTIQESNLIVSPEIMGKADKVIK